MSLFGRGTKGVFMFWCYILKACGLTVLFLSLTNRNPKVVWCGHRVLLPPKSHECILCILLFNRYSLKEREREWELYLKWERHELLSTQQKAVSSLVLKKKKNWRLHIKGKSKRFLKVPSVSTVVLLTHFLFRIKKCGSLPKLI